MDTIWQHYYLLCSALFFYADLIRSFFLTEMHFYLEKEKKKAIVFFVSEYDYEVNKNQIQNLTYTTRILSLKLSSTICVGNVHLIATSATKIQFSAHLIFITIFLFLFPFCFVFLNTESIWLQHFWKVREKNLHEIAKHTHKHQSIAKRKSFIFSGAEQYRSDCDIKSATNGTENLLYKHQNMDSPNSVISRSPLQMRQASPFPLESTNRRYVTAAAPNPQDRHRSSGKHKFDLFTKNFRCICHLN